MEHLIPETLLVWLLQYGSIALFVLLALGIFALPIPDETLMVFAGFLMAHGKLAIIPSVIASWLGACVGITLSYVIGRTFGLYLIKKYGHWVRLSESKMMKVHNWFEKTGRWTLLIGYFIPGVRHLTGYAAGISKLEYPKFALFSYVGACLWVIIFLSLGYFLGLRWMQITEAWEEQWSGWLLIIAGVILLIIVLWYIVKKKVSRSS
jgi:membrane protein DedA with SNARE-associated domain